MKEQVSNRRTLLLRSMGFFLGTIIASGFISFRSGNSFTERMFSPGRVLFDQIEDIASRGPSVGQSFWLLFLALGLIGYVVGIWRKSPDFVVLSSVILAGYWLVTAFLVEVGGSIG